ncbi:MAG: hypothetical protein KDJ38_04545 [Gammaproteobacteria bacterium]|nr:hypothetical protein [Gammaproteobacteria bacterium]
MDNLLRDGDWWEIFEAQGDDASPISMLMDEQLAVFQQLWQQVSRQFPLSQLSLIEAMWLALSDKPAAEELSGPIAEYLKLLAKQQGFFLELFRQTLEAKTDTLQQASVGTFRQLMAELVTDFETRYTAQTGLAEYARIYGEMVNTGLVIEKIARRIRAEGQVCTNQTPGDCPDRAGFTNA